MSHRPAILSIRRALTLGAVLAACLYGASPGIAQTHEQIVERCRPLARPHVQACMQQNFRGHGGFRRRFTERAGQQGPGNADRESVLQRCRETVGKPVVRACVQREIQRLTSSKPAPAVPKGDEVAAVTGPFSSEMVAPPRTINDITAILDSEKPDATKITKLKADAEAPPPNRASSGDLAKFYYDRGNARALLGRLRDALADALKALELSKGGIDFQHAFRVHQFVALLNGNLGKPKQAIAAFEDLARLATSQNKRGALINTFSNMAQTYVTMGDVAKADAASRRVAALVKEARGSPSPGWRAGYQIYGTSYESDADTSRAVVLRARGQYREAEIGFRRAEAFRRAALKDRHKYEAPPPAEQMLGSAEFNLLAAARLQASQGRAKEGEADARRALLSMLKSHGKYHPRLPQFILGLAGILIEQGRNDEAEKLARSALEIQRTLGIGDESPQSAQILLQLGNILILERKLDEARRVYDQLEVAVRQWDPAQREYVLLNGSRIVALYASGQVEAGIAAAQELVKRNVAALGENDFETALSRGVLAQGYGWARRDADAAREYKAALAVMLKPGGQGGDGEDTSLVAVRKRRLQSIVEGYIGLLARTANKPEDVAAETFALSDAVRGRSVQQALASSSARMVAKDAALAALVRTEQDLSKQIGAQVGALNNMLALPSGERDEQTVRGINGALLKLRTDRDKARQEIARRFPNYAELVDPKPPSVDQVKASLRPGEALLSYYFGQFASFVWVVPKDGPVAFAKLQITARELETKVHRLRGALEPEVTAIADLPAFDLTRAHELYSVLLAPVDGSWRPAKELIVATNGALGLLPLSLLPTSPAEAASGETPFAGYKAVKWLTRTHAVTTVPSAAALRTLRSLPPGNANRGKLIAFGDPVFRKDPIAQAEQLEKPIVLASADADTMRGLPLQRRSSPSLDRVDNAELGMLPRLPDTADELKAIATALGADPAKALHLGKEANEQKVKSLDLSRFKVVAFATHGLIPGELTGLSQPALALSAPDVSNTEGDGLLTMGEILALKMDADWVVLSACNTGAGAGAGAEAASGLGQAFFYAGTRALLVTNWSVHSASARELVGDLFRRQAGDTKITRSEALRQAMLALMDGGGFKNAEGRMLYSYAHPLFWAPYSIIGDGGLN